MPKIVIPDIAMFSDEDRAHATRNEDGTYTIDVRPTEVVTQFRDNNLQLKQQVETGLQKLQAVGQTFGLDVKSFEDLDVDSIAGNYTSLVEIKKQVDDGKLVADTSLEAAIAARVAEHKAEADRRIGDLTKKLGEKDTDINRLGSEMNDYILTNEITLAVLDPESPIRQDALPDVLQRARGAFKVDGNKKLIAVDSEGRTVYGPDATNPLKPSEWLHQQAEKSTYLGKTSKGGGSDNFSGGQQGNLEAFASGADSASYVEGRFQAANKAQGGFSAP